MKYALVAVYALLGIGVVGQIDFTFQRCGYGVIRWWAYPLAVTLWPAGLLVIYPEPTCAEIKRVAA
jgi:hypothetical protein